MAPAPSPYGTDRMQSKQKEFDTENPNSAIAVSRVLRAVTSPVPNFLVSLSEYRLETIVLAEIIIDIIPHE